MTSFTSCSGTNMKVNSKQNCQLQNGAAISNKGLNRLQYLQWLHHYITSSKNVLTQTDRKKCIQASVRGHGNTLKLFLFKILDTLVRIAADNITQFADNQFITFTNICPAVNIFTSVKPPRTKWSRCLRRKAWVRRRNNPNVSKSVYKAPKIKNWICSTGVVGC